MTGTLSIELENVGGIEYTQREITDRTTFVRGPNAANKSSFLNGLLFALGTNTVPIRSGADKARVRLFSDDRHIDRVARRTDTGIEITGDAWIDDPDNVLLLERFAALLETNPLRNAVARNDDVESLLKEPMNIEALEEERAANMRQKRKLSEAIESTDDVEDRLKARERKLEAKRDRAESLETRLDELYDERDDEITDDDELQELREERAALRSEESTHVAQIEQLESAIERFESRLAELEADLEAAREATEGTDLDALKRERESVRNDLEDVTRRLEVLQSVLTANREMLDSEYTGVLGYESGLMGDDVTCWACGNAAPTEDFEETVTELSSLVAEEKRRRREHQPEIEDLTERIKEIRRAQSEIDELESEIGTVEQKIEQRRDSLEERRSQLAHVRERIDNLDEAIAEREAEQTSERSSQTSAIEESRVELRTLRREIERLEDACESLRETRAERKRKQSEIEDLTEEITALTDRIENLESELRDVFNEAMDDLLDALAFERIERVWLDGEFDLVIAREVDGQTRTDTLEHLAESEREMIGLVLALAGFVTYDVDEVTPVLVLDSLGAFDAERTRRLVDYFADETEYLLATVHPEFDIDAESDTITFEPAVSH